VLTYVSYVIVYYNFFILIFFFVAQDVTIVRVKNRMAQLLPHKACGQPSMEHRADEAGSEVQHAAASITAEATGYRDIAINLRVGTGQAVELGLDEHVAEVQLLLRDFADVKAEDGHARYIQWRNMRGE
jgi:hypothetical protein